MARRRYRAKHAPVSHKYLRDSLVQSPPSTDEVCPADDSTVATPQAEARSPQPRRQTRRSKTILDKDITSNPLGFDLEDESRRLKVARERAIKTLLARLTRADSDISRAKFSDVNNLSDDAVVIFLRRTGPNGGHVSDIFGKASELFSQEQLVEMTTRTITAPWTPPEFDKIRLKGEKAAGGVPVFDSCDEVRAKIHSYLRQPDGPGPWQLCKFLPSLLKATASKIITVQHLNRFMAQDGPFHGAGAVVYYAAYIFFEKLRIAEGRPKSNHRLEMERLYPRGIRRVTLKSKQHWNQI